MSTSPEQPTQPGAAKSSATVTQTPGGAPPTQPGALGTPRNPDAAREAYEVVRDSVGMVPNFRKKDNLLQLIVVAAFTVLGVASGVALNADSRLLGGLLGALAGLILGTFLSGLILMVMGWVRLARRRG